jgi:predicted regulator of Ras-like GTPase activity (Roadblock/LC7/MglB family)
VKKEKVNTAELELAIKDLVAVEGVNAAAVVTRRDGVLVEFLNRHTPEAVSSLASVIAMMAITAEKCTRIFKKGEMEELITKANGGVLLTERCGEFIFIVAVDKGFDLDSIKPQREKVKEAIEGMI